MSGFTKVPHWLIRDSDLDREELLVYLVLLDHRDHVTGFSLPYIQQIADEARLSRSSVQRAIGKLRDRGLIETYYRTGRATEYLVEEPGEEAPNDKLEHGARIPKRKPRETTQVSENRVDSADESLIDQHQISDPGLGDLGSGLGDLGSGLGDLGTQVSETPLVEPFLEPNGIPTWGDARDERVRSNNEEPLEPDPSGWASVSRPSRPSWMKPPRRDLDVARLSRMGDPEDASDVRGVA